MISSRCSPCWSLRLRVLCAGLTIAVSLLGPVSPALSETIVPQGVLVVGRAGPELPFTDAPTEARRGDGAELRVVLLGREGGRRGKKVVVADDDTAPLVLGGRTVRESMRRPFSTIGPVSVRWSVVEPHAWREAGAVSRNGATTPYHTNVSVERESFGRWLGYDEITYYETALGDFDAHAEARRRDASARPPLQRDDVYGGLGTLRYKVELRLDDGTVIASKGAEAVDAYGILPSVHRVSIRADDTFLGTLTSYFMVPEVFGSSGSGRNNQTDRFVGADCADVLTGALRAAGYSKVEHSHVAGLTKYATTVAGPAALDEEGAPDSPVSGVEVGDVIRIDYGGAYTNHTPRAWDHVAVLFEDRSDPDGPQEGGPDGHLDGFDLVVHMGHPHLVVEPMSGQSPARIDVLRWSPKRIGKRR